jgi:hypothetical protein
MPVDFHNLRLIVLDKARMNVPGVGGRGLAVKVAQ